MKYTVNRGLHLLMLACAVGLTMQAHADDGTDIDVPIQGPLTVGHLDAIMQEEILYKAQVARAKQHAELAKFESASSKTRAIDSFALPNVAWRRATASGWLAKFVFQDGTSMIAGRGEPLPGGLEVAHITEGGIQLKHNGRLIDLSPTTPSARPKELPVPDSAVTSHPDVLTAGHSAPM
ncbi:hypothetical protein CSC67_07915 [Pusillimonas caeni]|uniref:hypothetical protein n=1 Tax=Pusillimonas caeni TaxID=1348472 RepID=UPI0010753C5E|nr:hypothetical protein [Pusillimonas caeni]TFL14083.1 hypothetical protein CSC67_07915 [Pusillimonas caeni]